jgi:hypothetical protein
MTQTPKVPPVPEPKFTESTDDVKFVVFIGGVRPSKVGAK